LGKKGPRVPLGVNRDQGLPAPNPLRIPFKPDHLMMESSENPHATVGLRVDFIVIRMNAGTATSFPPRISDCLTWGMDVLQFV
jgi:hypothetical protein